MLAAWHQRQVARGLSACAVRAQGCESPVFGNLEGRDGPVRFDAFCRCVGDGLRRVLQNKRTEQVREGGRRAGESVVGRGRRREAEKESRRSEKKK